MMHIQSHQVIGQRPAKSVIDQLNGQVVGPHDQSLISYSAFGSINSALQVEVVIREPHVCRSTLGGELPNFIVV